MCEESQVLKINDDGIVLAVCETYFPEPPQFCTIDVNTNQFDIITQIDDQFNIELEPFEAYRMVVNNQGQALHYCRIELADDIDFRLCTYDVSLGDISTLSLEAFPQNPVSDGSWFGTRIL